MNNLYSIFLLICYGIILCVIAISFYRIAKHIWEGILVRDKGQIVINTIILLVMIAVFVGCVMLSNPRITGVGSIDHF